jgi:hypothetical protein
MNKEKINLDSVFRKFNEAGTGYMSKKEFIKMFK